MDMKNLFRGSSFLLAIGALLLAHGVIIEGTFKGLVTDAQSFVEDLVPIWSENIIG